MGVLDSKTVRHLSFCDFIMYYTICILLIVTDFHAILLATSRLQFNDADGEDHPVYHKFVEAASNVSHLIHSLVGPPILPLMTWFLQIPYFSHLRMMLLIRVLLKKVRIEQPPLMQNNILIYEGENWELHPCRLGHSSTVSCNTVTMMTKFKVS